jgi:hypothetical protein
VWTDSWLSIIGSCSDLIGGVLVLVKNKCERSMQVRPPGVEQTSRHGSRDLMASGIKCGSHGGKNSKTKSWMVFLGYSSTPRSSRDDVGAKS